MSFKDMITRCVAGFVCFLFLCYLFATPYLAGLGIFFWVPVVAYYDVRNWRHRRAALRMPTSDQFDREWRDFLNQENTR